MRKVTQKWLRFEKAVIIFKAYSKENILGTRQTTYFFLLICSLMCNYLSVLLKYILWFLSKIIQHIIVIVYHIPHVYIDNNTYYPFPYHS